MTVHVEHCSQCEEDLAALRELNLTAPQLKRLSQFFESGRGEGVSPLRSPCQAKPEGQDIFAAAAQGSVFIEGAAVSCDDVSTADIFDCVVPFGAPPDERHRTVVFHIRACSACTAKVQMLHRTIHGILERADSDTTTVYHAQSDAEADNGRRAGAHPYPIEVQVLHGDSGQPPIQAIRKWLGRPAHPGSNSLSDRPRPATDVRRIGSFSPERPLSPLP